MLPPYSVFSFLPACVFAPATTNLRGLAKKSLLTPSSVASSSEVDQNQAVLSLPVSLGTIADIFLDNKELLLKEYASDPGIPFHISVLTEYREKYSEWFLNKEEVVVFNDKNINSELVYGIMVNQYVVLRLLATGFWWAPLSLTALPRFLVRRSLKRITLFFRGSVSAMDYKMDFKIGMNKLVDAEGQKVFVHRGFSTYLLDKKYNGGKSAQESKFNEIVRELDGFFRRFPDYRLYVTGHSLGGSLALIAAFQLAPLLTLPDGEGICVDTRRPLTCITFGPLQVGDIRLRRAFQRMERENLINNLNIINRGDLIPLYPVWTGTKWYRFMGNKLKLANYNVAEGLDGSGEQLKKGRKCTISRAPESASCFTAWLNDIPNQLKYTARLFGVLCCERQFWLNHTVMETSLNLKANEKYLQQMTWTKLYDNCRPDPVTLARGSDEEQNKHSGHGRHSIFLSTFLLEKED